MNSLTSASACYFTFCSDFASRGSFHCVCVLITKLPQSVPWRSIEVKMEYLILTRISHEAEHIPALLFCFHLLSFSVFLPLSQPIQVKDKNHLELYSEKCLLSLEMIPENKLLLSSVMHIHKMGLKQEVTSGLAVVRLLLKTIL